jgi:Kef-type K+ transport system membrane component KefB
MFDASTELARLPPLARCCAAMLIPVAVPPLCRRIRLPAVLGLMAAGVLIGPSSLRLVPKNSDG